MKLIRYKADLLVYAPVVILTVLLLAGCPSPTAPDDPNDPVDPPAPQPTVELVVDINSGAGSSLPEKMAVYSGALYFGADDGTFGKELWRYNGSSAVRLTDINTAGDSSPDYLTEYNTNLYFSAKETGATFPSLYEHDGTNTVKITSLNLPSHLTAYDGLLYLAAFDVLVNGQELWSYNGALESSAADINSGGEGSFPSFLTEMAGVLYFQADADNNVGSINSELWKYDTTNGDSQVGEINASGNGFPRYLIVFNGLLYFTANDGSTGNELWSSNGTTVSRITDLNSGAGDGVIATDMIVFNSKLYFNGDDGSTGYELWEYNGSSTSRISDLNAGSGSSLPINPYFAIYNNALYFGASDGSTGIELWKYDGSTVSLAGDINPGGDSNPSHLTVYNSRLYFQANDGNSGAELWVYY